MKKNLLKFDIFTVFGIYLVLSVILDQIVNFSKYGDPLELLWFCNITALFVGIGLLLRNKIIPSIAIVMIIPAQFVWILDFFLEMFGYGLGRTALLRGYGPLVFWTSVNLHTMIIPICVYTVYKWGFYKKVLPIALLYLTVLLTSTFLLTPTIENRNCVFYACDASDPGGGYLTYFLFKSLLFWLIMGVISFYSLRVIFRKRLI